MKPALKATIHNPSFASLSKNDCMAAAIVDIEDEVFWKAIYCLLFAVFPALNALRYCDSNIPAMDKIYFLAKQAYEALLDSRCFLTIRICLVLQGEWFYLTAMKNWIKFLVKQIQKRIMSYYGKGVYFLFIHFKRNYHLIPFSVMMTIMMSSLLEMQYCLHGRSRRIGWNMYMQ